MSPCFTMYMPSFEVDIGFIAPGLVVVDGFDETVFIGFDEDVGFFVEEELLFDEFVGLLLLVGLFVLDELPLLFVILLFDEVVPLFEARVPPPFCFVLGVRACILASSAAVM